MSMRESSAAALDPSDHAGWPLRPWLLLGLGGALGLAFHFLIRGDHSWDMTNDPLRVAGATFVAVAGVVFAFSLERLRWTWSAAFALLCGFVVASVAARNPGPDDWGSNEGWQFFSSLLAVAVAVPLFQAVRDQGSSRIAVRAVHGHVWSNLILGATAGVFVGATFLVTMLLAALFDLIGLHFLSDLFRKGWFGWMLFGGALGAAIGLLRDRGALLGTAQRVARSVLSVLAPLLAVGLVVFVVALPFTGLAPLWSQTKATTPILLACVLASLVLANAVIGNAGEEEPALRPLRYAAAALCAVMLPLAAVAAVSTARRIGQYGYTPDRLWAAVAIAVALAAGTAYLVALVRGKGGWPAEIRRANVAVAIGLCLLALFLALPIVSFGAISTRDQVARLEAGTIPPDKFDWAALRFDFGPEGRAALQRLSASRSAAVAAMAGRASATTSRWDARPEDQRDTVAARALGGRIRLIPGTAALPPQLAGLIGESYQCKTGEQCTLLFLSTGREALFFQHSCFASVRTPQACEPTRYVLQGGRWIVADEIVAPDAARRVGDGLARGAIEVRTVKRRQAFVGGEPVGRPFD